jgi:hypothetical protein
MHAYLIYFRTSEAQYHRIWADEDLGKVTRM